MLNADAKKWLFACLLLLLVTLAIYIRVIDYGFLNYDDYQYIIDNPNVNTGITATNLYWAFTAVHHANWHPLTWVSHMIDVELYGLRSGLHHLTNLLFHLLNTGLLVFLLNRMQLSFWPSITVACMFALHPAHVESVAWVAERKDVLSTFFFLLTLISYFYFVAKKNIYRYFLVAVFFLLGLMSKAMVITIPFVLLLIDFWPLRRVPENGTAISENLLKLILEKIPFFLFSIVSLVFIFHAQQSSGAMKLFSDTGLIERAGHALVSYLHYLLKIFVPLDQSVFYPRPDNLPVGYVVLSCIAVAGISFIAILWRKDYPYFLFGWFFFVGTLVPVIGLVPIGGHAIADRYTYIPYIGIFLAFSLFMQELFRKKQFLKKPVILLVAGLLLNMTVLASTYLSYWENDIRLFSHVLRTQDPGYEKILHGELRDQAAGKVPVTLAEIYSNLGISLMETGYLDQAIIHLNEAKRIHPSFFKPFYGLGHVYWQQEKYDLAYNSILHAIKLYPEGKLEFEKELQAIEALQKQDITPINEQ